MADYYYDPVYNTMVQDYPRMVSKSQKLTLENIDKYNLK